MEYYPEVEDPPKDIFRNGDTIKVINKGQTYDYASDKANFHGLTNFVRGAKPYEGEIGNILEKVQGLQYEAYAVRTENGEFMMSPKGLEKYEYVIEKPIKIKQYKNFYPMYGGSEYMPYKVIRDNILYINLKKETLYLIEPDIKAPSYTFNGFTKEDLEEILQGLDDDPIFNGENLNGIR